MKIPFNEKLAGGQERLMHDLNELLDDVKALNFHDFYSESYATPKVALVERLNELIGNTKNGDYDNTEDDVEDYRKKVEKYERKSMPL